MSCQVLSPHGQCDFPALDTAVCARLCVYLCTAGGWQRGTRKRSRAQLFLWCPVTARIRHPCQCAREVRHRKGQVTFCTHCKVSSLSCHSLCAGSQRFLALRHMSCLRVGLSSGSLGGVSHPRGGQRPKEEVERSLALGGFRRADPSEGTGLGLGRHSGGKAASPGLPFRCPDFWRRSCWDIRVPTCSQPLHKLQPTRATVAC